MELKSAPSQLVAFVAASSVGRPSISWTFLLNAYKIEGYSVWMLSIDAYTGDCATKLIKSGESMLLTALDHIIFCGQDRQSSVLLDADFFSPARNWSKSVSLWFRGGDKPRIKAIADTNVGKATIGRQNSGISAKLWKLFVISTI
jgi:hypothetical protein